MSTRKRLIAAASVFGVQNLQRWLSSKSPDEVEAAGARFGRLLYRVGRKRRDVALRNLALALPERGPVEHERIARACFEHFGLVSADFLASARLEAQEVLSSIQVEGAHHVHEAMAAGRGALIVTGHFGNWERAAKYVSFSGYPINMVIRDANQEGVNRLVNQLREHSGAKVIPRGNAARPILERLRKNETVAILVDQNAEDAFLPFFGHLAGTNLGAGVLHERTGSPVLPCYCVRVGPQRYRVFIDDPIVPDPGYPVKGEGTLRAVNRFLEKAIREYPEQWLWFHDRWRNAREAGLL